MADTNGVQLSVDVALGLLPPSTYLTTMGDVSIYGGGKQMKFYYTKGSSNSSFFCTAINTNTGAGYCRPVFYMP